MSRIPPYPTRWPSAGFTLIELLVVFSLLALLLTIAVPRYMSATEGAKQKVRSQNLATLQDAIDKFRADQGRYPSQLSELVDKRYLRMIPVDPVTDSSAWTPLSGIFPGEAGVQDVAPPKPDDAGAVADPAS